MTRVALGDGAATEGQTGRLLNDILTSLHGLLPKQGSVDLSAEQVATALGFPAGADRNRFIRQFRSATIDAQGSFNVELRGTFKTRTADGTSLALGPKIGGRITADTLTLEDGWKSDGHGIDKMVRHDGSITVHGHGFLGFSGEETFPIHPAPVA